MKGFSKPVNAYEVLLYSFGVEVIYGICSTESWTEPKEVWS